VIRLEQTNKKDDALPADDAAYVVVPPPKALSVLLVTDSNYYLEKLKTSVQMKEFDILSPNAYEDAKPTKYDVILFDRYPNMKYLPTSGNFMYFNCVPPRSKLTQQMNGPRPLFTQDNGVLDWKRDHPMLRGLNLGKRYIKTALRLNLPLGAERLVDGDKGPLVVMLREGRSTHLVVAFDVMESDWPLKLSFPIFMYNALQYLALGSEMDVREAYDPGATPTIPLADIKRVAADKTEIHLNGPDGQKTIKIPETGEFALPALTRVGLYTLDVPVPGYDKLAVNLLDPNESNLIPSPQAPGGIGEVQSSAGKTRMELWWYLTALVVPLLLVEWFVYTRRVHL
jgi:hypothetical protein